MEYYPGMLDDQTNYEDSMAHNDAMTISYKDWDAILLTICQREVELEYRLGNDPNSLQNELKALKLLKQKVIDKIR